LIILIKEYAEKEDQVLYIFCDPTSYLIEQVYLNNTMENKKCIIMQEANVSYPSPDTEVILAPFLIKPCEGDLFVDFMYNKLIGVMLEYLNRNRIIWVYRDYTHASLFYIKARIPSHRFKLIYPMQDKYAIFKEPYDPLNFIGLLNSSGQPYDEHRNILIRFRGQMDKLYGDQFTSLSQQVTLTDLDLDDINQAPASNDVNPICYVPYKIYR
jgi:hypothetical protein